MPVMSLRARSQRVPLPKILIHHSPCPNTKNTKLLPYLPSSPMYDTLFKR